MPRLYNIHVDEEIPPGAVYIGRPGKWGNSFVIGKDGDRNTVVVRHEAKVLDDPAMIAMIKKELRGKDLLCFCAPLRCHGEIYLRIANE